ncbi:STAS domain-containing protein [Chondromyces apiculatus]|uniref:RsbR, positive regulator of sigma-B n=1 Tax=Chondromyces apiculatus DSM 436 TaxID=1192034 RepID=A0A017TDD2_9BACT|nr:STAS domain-containing protein [Chondromyces apiculatus]EYF06932.1 RsbR, positive regulator of sigma-B [Chondromyces apiculatus DSM 436]
MTKTLAACMAGLDLLALPAWVLDPERIQIVWANDLAASLWSAEDREALIARDFSDISPSMRTRVARQASEARAGRSVVEQTTFYPLGFPATVTTHTTAIGLPDGRVGLLVQVTERDTAPDADLVRGIEAVRHSATLVAMIALDGELLMRNPATLSAFGDTSFHQWFSEADASLSLLQQVIDTGHVTAEHIVRTTEGERFHTIDMRMVRDPVTGEPVALVQQVDDTARLLTEQAAEADALVLARQHEEILALSVPVLEVGLRQLALPIIGTLDAARATRIVDQLLPTVVERGATSVILDLTGVTHLDADSAGRLLQIAHTIQLLGARTVLSGIRPDAARLLVGCGSDLSGFLVRRTLRDALERAGRDDR